MSLGPRVLPTVLFLVLALLLASPGWAEDGEIRPAVDTLERLAKEPFEQRERERAIRRLGRVGGPHAVRALFDLFDDPFVHLRDHVTSAWIAMLRGERADASRAALVDRALDHRNVLVRRSAALALGIAGGAEARAPLKARLAKEKKPLVQAALVSALGRLGAPPTLDSVGRASGDVLLALADAHRRAGRRGAGVPRVSSTARDPLARAAAVQLDGLAERLDAARVEAVLGDEADEVRITLADLMGTDPALALDAALPRLLADPSWRVRAAAIRAGRRGEAVAVVGLLIDRLEVEQGRLRLDLLMALQFLTGQTIDDDVELWRAWWVQNEATFVEATRAPELIAPAPETTTRAFFRLPITSTRVAFLIDCSGSMRDPAFEDRPEAGTKFERARAELEKTLASFDADTHFDVFLYRYPSAYPPRPRMTRALGRLEPATKTKVGRAVRWLGGEKAKGWGAFYDALVAIAAEEVDTIYFLSDGRPSRGTYDRDFRLLDEFDAANRFRQVVVHTVLVGRAKADRAFLRDLARRTGGLFVDATRD